MRPLSLAVLSLVLCGCTTDVGQPTFMAALNASVKDPEVLKAACRGREFPDGEVNAAAQHTKFSDFSSSRSVFGKDGTGQVSFVYTPTSGAPCEATMTFAFHQETTAKQYSKRNIAYSSTIELSNVVVAPK